MRQATGTIEVETRRQGLVEITSDVTGWVAEQAINEGLLTVFCRHTSASLLIQENAAREVRSDLESYFARIAPPKTRPLTRTTMRDPTTCPRTCARH